MANIFNTIKKLFWTTPDSWKKKQSVLKNKYTKPDSVSGAAIQFKPPLAKPDVISGAGYSVKPPAPKVVRVGTTPPSPTGNLKSGMPAYSATNGVATAAKNLIKAKTGVNNTNPTRTANQNTNMLSGVKPYAGGSLGARPTPTPAKQIPTGYQGGSLGQRGTGPQVMTSSANNLTAQQILDASGFTQLEKDLNAQKAQGGITPESDSNDLSQYLNELSGNGAYSTVDNQAPLSREDYIKQAIDALAPVLLDKLGGYKTSLDNTLTGYNNNANQVSLNADGSIKDNSRATTANINNFSNASLSRGLGRSTIATTGMGELGVIGQRQEGEIKATRDAALANIESMKAAANREYETNVATAKSSAASLASANGADLYNNALDRSLKIDEYNKSILTDKQNAAIEMRNKALAAKAKKEQDAIDATLENKKIDVTEKANNMKDDYNRYKTQTDKTLKEQDLAIKTAAQKLKESQAAVKKLQDENAAKAKVEAARIKAEADKKALDKKIDAQKRGQDIGLKKTTITANTKKTGATKGLPEITPAKYNEHISNIAKIKAIPDTAQSIPLKKQAINAIITEVRAMNDGPKKADLMKRLGIK